MPVSGSQSLSRRAEPASPPVGFAQLLYFLPAYASHRCEDELSHPVTGLDALLGVGEVDENDAHVATVVGVDRARCVEHGEAPLESEAAAGPHLGFVPSRDLEAQTAGDKCPGSGRQTQRFIEVGAQVEPAISGDVVVWRDCRACVDGGHVAADIYRIDLGSGALEQTAERLGVIEVDEATMPAVFAALRPRVTVFLNLFRDQRDRYGEVDSVAEGWRSALATAGGATTLALNGDDPAIALLAEAGGDVVSR